MSKAAIRKKLETALKQSPFRKNVRRISLFGSHLHGTMRPESDIDLLIEFNKPMSMLKLVHMEMDLSSAFGTKVDLCTPMSLSKYFRSDVLREAEPVFL